MRLQKSSMYNHGVILAISRYNMKIREKPAEEVIPRQGFWEMWKNFNPAGIQAKKMSVKTSVALLRCKIGFWGLGCPHICKSFSAQ